LDKIADEHLPPSSFRKGIREAAGSAKKIAFEATSGFVAVVFRTGRATKLINHARQRVVATAGRF